MMQERQRPPVAGNPVVLARGWIVAILVVASITCSPAAGDGWIMADVVNGSAVCPAHCLTVNQTAAGRGGSYRGQIVGFAPCTAASSAQIWSYDPGSQTISIQQPRLGIPACLEVRSNVTLSGIFLDACASPAPRTQLWRIDAGNASIVSLAFFPEKVLGMSVTAGGLSWRDAVLLGGAGDGKDYRTVMSLVSLVPALDAASAPLPVRGNLVSNGGFERCSYDVTEASPAVTLSTEEFFGPCFWNIGDGRVQIFGPGREIVEGNLALALGGDTLSGSVSQALSTEPLLDYLLSFLMSANSSCGGDVKRMEVTAVSFGLQFASTQSFNSSGLSDRDMGWTLRLLQFTATDTVTKVSFRSLEEDACGPFIDDVRVQPFLLHLSPALQPRAVCDCGFWGGAGAIIGAAVAAFCAGIAVFAFWYVASRKPRDNSRENNLADLGGSSKSIDTTVVDTTTRSLNGLYGFSPTSTRRVVFSYDEINLATRGFTTGLGVGTRAVAYLATLEPERIRAVVKREYRTARVSDQDFMVEVGMLLQLDHRNLVRILGFCKDQGEHILVYEYMEGGSLHDRLHSDSNPALGWTDRTKIARDVAAGLEYLHHGASPSILHRNLSSHNVLLTARLHAKLMDFGSARHVQITDRRTPDHRHAASAGYMDPVVLRNEATYTKKSDVYSFGVLLLELLTGLEAARVVLEAREYLTFKNKMQQLLDPRLEGRIFPRELEVLIEVAQKCMHHSEDDRPSMQQLCKLLEDTAAAPSGEIQPAPTGTRSGAP